MEYQEAFVEYQEAFVEYQEAFVEYQEAIYDIGTELLIPELKVCLPYKNYTFFKKSRRFPDNSDEI